MNRATVIKRLGTSKRELYTDRTNKPNVLPVQQEGIPTELKAEPRWVLWAFEWKGKKDGTGKWDKVPKRADGRNASSTDPKTWATFTDALAAYQSGPFAGIGFVLGDGWAGVDLDSVRDPQTGGLTVDWADDLLSVGGYAEVSPSETGLKLIGRGSWHVGRNRKSHPQGGEVEVYTHGRYFTVTGHVIGTTAPSLDLQPTLDAVASVFAPLPPPPPPPVAPAGGSCPESDDDLLDRIRGSKRGPKFTALFDHGDVSAYGEDESRAGMALVQMLAFWTSGDAARIDRLFRMSALMRPKWDSRRGDSTWGRMTIERVLRGQTELYQPDRPRKCKGAASPKRKSEGPGDGDEHEGRQPAAEVLANIGFSETELWHDATGAGFATFGWRTLAVRSKGFKQWLTRRYRELTDGKVATGDALTNAMNAVEAVAVHDGAEHEAHVRVALHDEKVYLHLADAADTVIEVDADGWRVNEKPPVRFRRAAGARSLPMPQPGGRLDDLRDLLGLTDEDQYALVVGYLCGMLRPSGPMPVLVLSGEQGSGKSTLTRALKRLVDPTAAEVRSEPKDARDLMISTRGNHLLCLENMSEIRAWLSDALCRLSTGGGLATRALYSDEDEAIFDARRPVVVNGIEDLVTRSDLLERSILLYLPIIPADRRTGEQELWGCFAELLPLLIGASLDRVSGGLRVLPRVQLGQSPRMADFARWAVACERGAGEPPRFMDAYKGNQAAAHAQALDGSSLASLVVRLVAASHGRWEGTATSLYEALQEYLPPLIPQDWPRAANAVTGPLRRLAPNLRKVHGIDVTFDRTTDSTRTRLIRICWPAAEAEAKRRSRLAGMSEVPERTTLAEQSTEGIPIPTHQADFQAGPDDSDGSDGSPQPSLPVSHEEFKAFLNEH